MIPWNKGLKVSTRTNPPWNKGLKGLQVAWNKGLRSVEPKRQGKVDYPTKAQWAGMVQRLGRPVHEMRVERRAYAGAKSCCRESPEPGAILGSRARNR